MQVQTNPVAAAPCGLIRLSLAQLRNLPLCHLVTGLDEGSPGREQCGNAWALSGYTEWITQGDNPVTLGWDWLAEPGNGALRWSRVGAPFSNLMLVDSAQRDYGWSRNLAALSSYVDRLAWHQVVGQALSARYV